MGKSDAGVPRGAIVGTGPGGDTNDDSCLTADGNGAAAVTTGGCCSVVASLEVGPGAASSKGEEGEAVPAVFEPCPAVEA